MSNQIDTGSIRTMFPKASTVATYSFSALATIQSLCNEVDDLQIDNRVLQQRIDAAAPVYLDNTKCKLCGNSAVYMSIYDEPMCIECYRKYGQVRWHDNPEDKKETIQP